MNFWNKLLNFGTSGKGKIISWATVGFAVLIFFVGILLIAIPNFGGNNGGVKSVTLVASGMDYRAMFSGRTSNGTVIDYTDAYYLDITNPRTEIAVNTENKGNVTFKTDSPLVSFEKETIGAGDTAIVLLNKVNGFYVFSDPDPKKNVDNITIRVSSGSTNLATIYVRIVLDPNDWDINAELLSSSNGVNWQKADAIETKYFDTTNVDFDTVKYRIRLRMAIWGETFYDSETNGFSKFDYEELYDKSPDTPVNPNVGGAETLTLFSNGNHNIFIDQDFINVDKETEITYRLICNYDNTNSFTKDNFKIRLIV